MAQLNLVPDPAIVGTQIVIFVANMAIVKKFFVEPYLKLRSKRDALTTGSQAEAARLLYESDQIAKKVEDAINDAVLAAASERDRIKALANEKRAEIVRAAEEKVKSEVGAVSSRIKAELSEQRTLLPQVISTLTNEFFSASTNKN